jgi:hypothetical protein
MKECPVGAGFDKRAICLSSWIYRSLPVTHSSSSSSSWGYCSQAVLISQFVSIDQYAAHVSAASSVLPCPAKQRLASRLLQKHHNHLHMVLLLPLLSGAAAVRMSWRCWS